MAKAKTKSTDKQTLENTPRENNLPGGKITMSDHVVATIAGHAIRDLPGIHAIGKSRLMSFGGDDPTHGIEAEVGSKEAALDLEVTLEYGSNVREVVRSVREKAAEAVDKMTGRTVVEVNVDIIGIHLPEEEPEPPKEEPPRVR